MYNLTDAENLHYVDDVWYQPGVTFVPALCGKVLEKAPRRETRSSSAPLCPHCRQVLLGGRMEPISYWQFDVKPLPKSTVVTAGY